MKYILSFSIIVFSQTAFGMIVTVCNDFESDGRSQYSIVIETTENFGIFKAQMNEKDKNTKTHYKTTRQIFRSTSQRQPDSIFYLAEGSEEQDGFKLSINTSKPLEYEAYSTILSTPFEDRVLVRHMECNFFHKQPRDLDQ